MKKLISEQLPNDGGYHIKRLVDEANARLKQIGKQGKRATIVAKKTSLSLQFTFHDGNGNSQKNVGLGAIPVSPKGIAEAEKLAQLVTGQLVANRFTWDWFNSLIGKDTSEQTKQLTCKEMVEQFKKHFFKQRKGNKTVEKSWYERNRELEKILTNLNEPLSLSLIREIIETSDNNTDRRKRIIQGLVEFLKFHCTDDYKDIIKKYKASNNPKRKKRNVPSDHRIMEVFRTGFIPKARANSRFKYRYSQWQFLYGLLATYGLRIHEAWNIANWDKPVTLNNGDWVTVDVDDNEEISLQHDDDDLDIPAILDPNNTQHILCIKHATKTGYRATIPLSPEGHNWIREFNLLQPLNLPDIDNPLERADNNTGSYKCTKGATKWFYNHKYGFTPHDLRHACNHRGHQSGYSPKVLADSLGHSLTTNNHCYLWHMSDNVKVQGMISAITENQNKRSEVELFREENKALKAELEAANGKIELLEAKLKLNQTLKES